MDVHVTRAVRHAPELHLALPARRRVAVRVPPLDGEDTGRPDFEIQHGVAEQDAPGDHRPAGLARPLHHELLAHQHQRHLVRPGDADDVGCFVGSVAVVEDLPASDGVLVLARSPVFARRESADDDGERRLAGDEPVPSRVVRLHHEARAFPRDGPVRPGSLNLARGEADILGSDVDRHRRLRQVHSVQRHGHDVCANLRPAHRRDGPRAPGL